MPVEQPMYLESGEVFYLIPTPYCKFCAKPLKDDFGNSTEMCNDCYKRVEDFDRLAIEEGLKGHDDLWSGRKPYHFDQAGAAGIYCNKEQDNFFYKTIWNLKNGTDADNPAILLAEAMVKAMENRYGDFLRTDFMVPIPSGTRNHLFPSSRLATKMSSLIRQSTVLECLRISDGYKSQKGVAGSERWNNPRGKIHFMASADFTLEGKDVLLVDDTLVTCSTSHWASKVLLDNGARRVYVMCAGRDVSQRELREFVGYKGRI